METKIDEDKTGIMFKGQPNQEEESKLPKVKVGKNELEGYYQRWDTEPTKELVLLPEGVYYTDKDTYIVDLGKAPSAKHRYVKVRKIDKEIEEESE